MSKIIFFTDLHYGANLLARNPNDISIYGKDWAMPLLRGVIKYAQSTPGTTLLSGGDEITFLSPNKDKSRKNEAKYWNVRNANAIKEVALSARIPFARAIGNHDLRYRADQMAFNKYSHVFSKNALPHTDIIICQPDVKMTSQGPHWFYDPDRIIPLIDDITNPNLVIGAHWSFDRSDVVGKASGYKYTDNTTAIRQHIESRMTEGKLHSVVSLHGHSHRYRFSNNGAMDILTLPALTQNDFVMTEFPCGIFCEIKEDEASGELTTTFKQIILQDTEGHQSVVRRVSPDDMKKYERGSTPRAQKSYHW
ncbi:MAG: hypothetical protein R3D88_05945 [Alphaproteobacteria bacterium]|nr:hypothetical protein [Alphaproteobacteria bacterium]